jgi:hypothetical protein
MTTNQPDIDKTLGELAGAASMCWTPKPTGVFDSEQATKFVDEAKAQIEQYIENKVVEARIDELGKLNWASLTWRDDLAEFILYSSDLHDLKNARLKALNKEGEK